MPSSQHPARGRRGARAVPLDVLCRLLREIAEDGAPGAEPEAPYLVALPGPAGEHVGLLPLDDLDPAEVLARVDPPPGCGALAFVTTGWASEGEDAAARTDWRTLAVDGPRPSQRPGAQRCRIVQGVGRDGSAVLALGRAGAPALVASEPDGGLAGGPVGAVPDALRRAFGLPCAPCPVSPLEHWTAWWLAEVLAVVDHPGPTPPPVRALLLADGVRRPRPSDLARSWPAIVGLHPAVRALAEVGHGGLGAAELVAAGRALARVQGWEALRLGCASGAHRVEGVPPAVASFADVAMFARLAHRTVPPLWSSVRALAERCPPDVLVPLQDALTRWDLPFAPPGAPAAA